MMNAHQLAHLATLAGRSARPLAAGQAMALGTSGGRLEVIAGRVWLTRAGELDDHVVEAGESLCIAASRDAVIEAWDEARPALVAWRPRRPVERAADALRSARAVAARLFLHNAGDGGTGSERGQGRAPGAAQAAGRCATGTA